MLMNKRKKFIMESLGGIEKNDSERSINIQISTVSQLNIFSAVNDPSVLAQSAIKERKRLYRVCHGIARQFDLYPEMRREMRERWRATSMQELDDTALQELEVYLRHIERDITSRGR